jgi:hypothetical protein
MLPPQDFVRLYRAIEGRSDRAIGPGL